MIIRSSRSAIKQFEIHDYKSQEIILIVRTRHLWDTKIIVNHISNIMFQTHQCIRCIIGVYIIYAFYAHY
jgi:hypothetical protein